MGRRLTVILPNSLTLRFDGMTPLRCIMMDSEGGLPAGDDLVTLRAANSALQAQNMKLQRELSSLKDQLAALKFELAGHCGAVGSGTGTNTEASKEEHPQLQPPPPRAAPRHGLSRTQAERYSRHLLLPSFGVAAQERLCRGSVLVVGCGGLGSPVAMYLAAAGVGRLGLVDHDTVDVTNLHRQVLHATSRVGMHKAVSGRITCAAINPTIQIEAHTGGFSPSTALGLVDAYDVVVDASDNPATRYLVSDACVVSGKPLVSAAAVGMDGQLTVYNYGDDGPCYRCLFPASPAPENCSRCGEAGVMGVVPGVMGCLQALEAIKILARVGDVSSKKLTIFDALAGRFTTVRLRSRNPTCVACGTSPAITRASLPSYDYVAFTGQPPDDGPPEDVRLIDPRVRLEPHQVVKILRRIQEEEEEEVRRQTQKTEGKAVEGEGTEAKALRSEGLQQQQQQRRRTTTTLFLDVRPKTQYDIMALPGVVHVPYERFEERLPELLTLLAGTEESNLSTCSFSCGTAAPATTTSITTSMMPVCGASSRCTDCRIQTTENSCGGGGAGGGGGDGAGSDGAGSGGGGEVLEADGSPGSGGVEGRDGGGGLGGEVDVGDRTVPAFRAPRVVVLCRRGNNSQRVVARLAGVLGAEGVTDMRGGYVAWAREVDPDMPLL